MDSYSGIATEVVYEVSAEMVYEGSVMNYTVRDSRIFQVRNSKQVTQSQSQASQSEENKQGEAAAGSE